MIRKVLLSTMLVILTISLSAQRFKGGLFAGVNASQVAGDISSGYKKLGITFGATVETQLNDSWGLKMELGFSQKGSRENPTDENGNTQMLMRLNYIDLPILVRYKINRPLTAQFGLGYGYLLYHYVENDYSTTAVAGTPFNTHALNILAGITYAISSRFQVDFRANTSLIPVRPHSSGASRWFNHGQYNDVLSLTLHYSLGQNEE